MARILVVGSLGWDRPIWLSGPISRGGRLHGTSLDGALGGRLGGGAANTASALALAGHHVAVASCVASDPAGDAIVAACVERGLDTSHVFRIPGETPHTHILIDPDGERLVLGLDLRVSRRVAAEGLPPVKVAGSFDAVILRSAIRRLTGLAKGPLVLAHLPGTEGVAQWADAVVGSRDDMGEDYWRDPFQTARSLCGERLAWAVATDGARGAVAATATSTLHCAAPPAIVRDTTGAGDVFLAGLADAQLGGANLDEALAHACAWGAAAVVYVGSAPLPGDMALSRFSRSL